VFPRVPFYTFCISFWPHSQEYSGTPVDDHLSYATTPPRRPNFLPQSRISAILSLHYATDVFCVKTEYETFVHLYILIQLRLEQTTTSALSRQHHLHSFSRKLKCGSGNIWRNVIHINHLNNISSKFLQNMPSSLAEDTTKMQNDDAVVNMILMLYRSSE
jgi:hypothetical protein